MLKKFLFGLGFLLVLFSDTFAQTELFLSPDPGSPDTVWLERIDSLSPNDSVTYHISFWTDSKLGAICIPITFYNSNNLDITLDSNSVVWGPDIDPFGLKIRNIKNGSKNALFTTSLFDTLYFVNPGKHDFVSFKFRSGPSWNPSISVAIDTTFFFPSNRVKFIDSLGIGYIPTVVKGYIITPPPPPPPDFSMGVGPDTQAVLVGGSTAYTVALTSINNWNFPCTLSVSGLPGGGNCSFFPNVVVPTGNSFMFVSTSGSTPPGSYILTVSAKNGDTTRSQNVTLIVALPEPDFGLNILPDIQYIEPGDSTQYKLYLNSLNNFNSWVSFTIPGIPPGVTYIFSPDSLIPTDSSVLTIYTPDTLTVAEYILRITATGGGKSHALDISLSLKSPHDVKDETGEREKPSEFTLFQNFPNPFNLSTKIEFSLPHSGFVNLDIFDIRGRKIRILVSENLSCGYKSVFWNGKDDFGEEVASGIYLYKLKVGNFTQTKKLVLLK
jgi:hypothetical protein